MAVLNTVRARIDNDTKRDAFAALDAMGITASEVIRHLFVRIAKEQALPFDIRVPNATTRAALEAANRGEVVRFDRVDALMADLNNE